MPYCGSVRTATRRTPPSAPSPSSTTAPTGITVYGCEPDEATLLREVAPLFGVRPTLVEAAPSEGNAELALGNRCISVSHKARLTAPTLRALSRAGVEYVSTRSAGYDHIDVECAESVGITVGNVGYPPDGVADYTLMLVLMLVRDARSIIRRAEAHDFRLGAARGRELRDLTVGVVGAGRIGTAVIDRLRGFGCRVLVHDRAVDGSAGTVPLDELLGQSDVVTLHTPLDAGTHHLLDRRRIALMKPGACVINTGRGPLIDTGALIAALEGGRLGGAALDVLEGEEGIFYADRRRRPVENEALLRLQELPNVLISPHTAYYTDHALRDTIESSLAGCLRFEAGRRRG